MPKVNPFLPFNNAYQHADTGEMWVPASDQSGMLVPTGYYFERVTQSLPNVNNMEGPRFPGVRISPWAFSAATTAADLLPAISSLVDRNVKVTIEPSSANTQFPYSHDMLQFVATRGDRKARINAGLLASNIARTTAVLDGQVKQFPAPALAAAAAELMRELEHVDE